MGSGYLPDKYGKKRSQLCSDLIPLVAALLIGCSEVSKSFEMILIGRLLFGINAGFGLNLHAQYASEIAPKSLRGFTNTSVAIFVVAGKLFGQIFGLSEVLGTVSCWPVLLAMSGIWALAQLVTLPFFPESPPYLLMQRGDKDGYMRALNQLWGERDHQAHTEEMMGEHAARRGGRSQGVLGLLRDRTLRWQLYTLVSMGIALQLCGINAIYFYASDVFEAAGFHLTQIPYITVGVGVCETLAAILCSLIVDHFGRRLLLLAGYGFMVLVLGLLTVTVSLQDRYTWMPHCSVLLIFLFSLSFGTGPGAVTITISLEMFSPETRAAAFIVVGLINWIGLFIIGMIFPYVEASLGPFCFLVFIGFIASSGIFLFFFLPETKGKSWLEISEEFNKFDFRGRHGLVTSGSPPQRHVASTKL
ncbi:solute carrier family 2, facilitated glucose transporter member 9-like isoform X3 [Ascaphus truei]